MDHVTGNENIAELFADKYKVLYNSVCLNNDQHKELLTVNNTDIESLCSHLIAEVHSLVQNHTHCITVSHVQVAIKKLKGAESDCTDHLVSDHFINGTDRLFTLISLLFTCMLSQIEYYDSNNTDCFMFLDASKAFDRIEYVRLFTLLHLRNMCPLVLRLIINIYIYLKECKLDLVLQCLVILVLAMG